MTPSSIFEPEFIAQLALMFEERICACTAA